MTTNGHPVEHPSTPPRIDSSAVPTPPSAAELFDAALRLPASDRITFVRRSCREDPDLREEVLSLLDHYDRADSFLSSNPLIPTNFAKNALAVAGDKPFEPGTVIGQYTIQSVIGEGGMGVVYRARQQNPARDVALKVIRPAAATPEVLRRFEYEAQVLGRLQHPGIAQIFEAGTALLADGSVRPFLAMELVRGTSLTQYANAQNLGLAERLELFASVCDAVNHAHQRGLIHRDLKPANILVTAAGEPKILDFGVARAAEVGAQQTLHTSAGQIVGTVPYMSPEQATLNHDDLDTRSDVYALGVILHELLTGRLPYDLSTKPIPEALQVIRTQEPTRLSSVSREFRGDIETIVGKALEKDRSRRYQSAAELAEDLRRHLRDDPIVARPPSTLYQLGKFAKRNKVVVASVLAIIAALTAGLGAALVQTQQARSQAVLANNISAFLRDMISTVDPVNAKGEPVTVTQVLDRGMLRLDHAFKGRPVVRASMLNALARAYANLGEWERAETASREAMGINRELLGMTHNDTLESVRILSIALYEQSKFTEAAPLVREALAAARRDPGVQRHLLEALITEQAIICDQLGMAEDAEKAYRESMTLNEQSEGPKGRGTITARSNLGVFLMDQGKLDAARLELERAVADSKDAFGPDHHDTMLAVANLGALYEKMGKTDAAEPLMRQAAELSEKINGPDHADTLLFRSNYGSLLMQIGKHEDAEAVLVPVLEKSRSKVGPTAISTVATIGLLARLHIKQHRFEDAERLALEYYELHTRLFGKTHDVTAKAATLPYEVYKAWGKTELAEKWMARAALPEPNQPASGAAPTAGSPNSPAQNPPQPAPLGG